MANIFVSICSALFFFFVVVFIKRNLFDEFGKPRAEAERFIVERKSFLHPNLISGYGLLFALIAMLLYYFHYYNSAVILYVVASYIDAIDGAVARASRLGTDLGKELDPLFDKAKTLPPIVYFAYQGCFEMWFAVAFVCLDIAGQLIRPVIHFLNWKYSWKLSVASNKFGQIKTVVASILIVYCDLQVRVEFVPKFAVYGLMAVIFLCLLLPKGML